MTKFKSANDIIDFAIDSEKQAYQFYKNLSNSTSDPTMRQVFNDFAKEEKQHQATLEGIKAGKTPLFDISTPITDLKISDYLPEIPASNEMDYKQALIVAMHREKKAYKLYSDLAVQIKDQNLKNLFLALAHEEANHKLRFELEYDELVFKGQ